MQLRRTVLQAKKHKIDVIENIVFAKKELDSFVAAFEKLKNAGHIIAGSFDDIKWKLPCHNKAVSLTFTFDIEIYQEINIALKGYIITKKLAGFSTSRCSTDLSRIKKMVIETQGLKQPNKFESLLLTSTEIMRLEYSITLKNFLSFYPVKSHDRFMKLCDSIPVVNRNNRELPHFHHVMAADEIMYKYFEQSYPKPIYLPIWLWWKITNVIPMRPTELLKTRIDCLEVQADGSYWITIHRIKGRKYSPEEIEQVQQIQIDEHIYNLINQYKLMLLNLDIKSEYLFPTELYYKSKKFTHKKRIGRMNLDQFSDLLDSFYTHIIELKFQEYAIGKRIRPGDTRHFAIINMFLQGFNMLSIARMAGHEIIESQENYYSHAVQFAESFVYKLAQNNVEDKIAASLSGGLLGWRREVIDKGRIYDYSEIQHFRGVDFGFCSDTAPNFPANCVEDCRLCDYYIFKPTIDEYHNGIKWLGDISEALHRKIKETIELMGKISPSMNEAYLQRADGPLKCYAYNLVNLMDQKARIDSRLMEVDMDGNEETEKNL